MSFQEINLLAIPILFGKDIGIAKLYFFASWEHIEASLNVYDRVLDDLNYRLVHIRWPNQLVDMGWERGTDISYLPSFISYWREQFN